MKKIRISIVFVLCIIVLASCSTMMSGGLRGVKPSANSPFAQSLLELDGSAFSISGSTVTLEKNLILPDGKKIVLDTGELWTFDFNGYTITFSAIEDGAAFEIISGGMIFTDGSGLIYEEVPGGITVYDGCGIYIGSLGSAQIKGGKFSALKKPCIEVAFDGILKISNGYIIGAEMPIAAEDGWQGSLSGGCYSSYNEVYESAVKSGCYISARFPEREDYFSYKFKDGFTIQKKGAYSGTSWLTIKSSENMEACYRLYRTYKADAYNKADQTPDYQWLLKPNQTKDVEFTSGNYVVKVAEGYNWTDENAFGRNGYYWYMDPYQFEDKLMYYFYTTTGNGMSNSDNLDGFLNGI